MKITLVSLVAIASFVLCACGEEGATPAKDPSSQDPTKVDPSSVGANTPEPSGPAEGIKPTSAAPASPADGGKCKSGAPSPKATTLDACLDSCKGMDSTVPPDSRCVSAKTSCASQCTAKFKP